MKVKQDFELLRVVGITLTPLMKLYMYISLQKFHVISTTEYGYLSFMFDLSTPGTEQM